MARDVFDAEIGLAIAEENGDRQVYIISGTAVPDGTSGEQQNAPIGSIYLRSGTGELYQKIANAGAPADYELNSATGGGQIGNWRPERVDAHTGQVLAAGNTDPTTWSDNDDGTAAAAFTVGHYVLDGNCALWEITGISAPNITLAAASTPPATDDMFAVKYNMPDPAGQENQAIITYDGSTCIKVADVDFASATGINLVAPYSPASGDPVAGDSVQAAIEKLDGNNDDQDTLLGTAQGDTDLGTFTGVTIPDSSSVKGALQSLETAYEETDQNVDDLITLSGVPENSTDFGTFTGDIIADNQTNKGAMQDLETELVDTRDNVDDLITLSGVPENSTDLGTFPGGIISDNTTVKGALTELEDAAEGFPESATGITTATVLDSVLVDEFRSCVWLVTAFEEASPANSKSEIIHVMNDGTSSADATQTDDTVYARLRLNGNFNVQVSSGVTGTGAAQVMELRVASSSAGITTTAVRLGCAPSGY